MMIAMVAAVVGTNKPIIGLRVAYRLGATDAPRHAVKKIVRYIGPDPCNSYSKTAASTEEALTIEFEASMLQKY
jgi:pyrimidine deaminase RibD-like protein